MATVSRVESLKVFTAVVLEERQFGVVLFRERVVQTLKSGCIVNHLVTHKHSLHDR